KLVESVPNFSEGRRLDVVEKLALAVTSIPGVHLLDRTSDASHNRSVLTLAGAPNPVQDALERAVGVAVHEIDMEEHSGEHPRIGAVDVIPFVPLGDSTLDDCVALAREFAARIATRFDLPVYLYAAAATRPDREKLADVRRGAAASAGQRVLDRGAGMCPGVDESPRLHGHVHVAGVGDGSSGGRRGRRRVARVGADRIGATGGPAGRCRSSGSLDRVDRR